MKILAASLICLLSMCACEKNCKSMLVVRDCTGTYLRVADKDYHVCNTEKLAKYSNGETVNAS